MESWILTVVVFSPLVGAIMMLLPPRGDEVSARRTAFFVSLVTLAVTVLAIFKFYDAAPDASSGDPRYLLSFNAPWIVGGDGEGSAIKIGYRIGVDGISIWLLALTALLMPLAIWSRLHIIAWPVMIQCNPVIRMT